MSHFKMDSSLDSIWFLSFIWILSSLDLGAGEAFLYFIPFLLALFHLLFIYIAIILCKKIIH